ncbi:MAG: hypothetical protein ACXVYM_04860 [Gaiellaceae bacterium]
MSTSDVGPYGPGGAPPLPAMPEDDWDDVPITPRARMPWLTRLLLLAAVAALAFGGGILANREWGTSGSNGGSRASGNSASSAASSFFGRARNGLGSSSTASGAFSGAGGGVTAGQIAYIKGSTLFVTDSSGNIVKVSLPNGLPVTKSVTTTAKSLRPGDTVVVRGQQGSDGTVKATSVSIGGGGLGISG